MNIHQIPYIIFIFITINILSFGHINAENKKKTSDSNTIKLEDTEFIKKVCDYQSNPKQWVYLGNKPAIIDFYADWCGPCKKISPRLEEIAKEYKDDIYVYKINIDEQQEIAVLFGINSIPSLLFIPMRNKPQIAQGLLPKETIKEAVENVLLNPKKEKIEEKLLEEVQTEEPSTNLTDKERIKKTDIKVPQKKTKKEPNNENDFRIAKAKMENFNENKKKNSLEDA